MNHCANVRRTRVSVIPVLALCTLLLFSVISPQKAFASQQDKAPVRVGWYDSTYNTVDENGFRSGYAYEYQLKLSAYNGWTYEYVSGSWPDLLHMLETGEIDLMSDVSYTPEREQYMYFPSLPMGTEEYYLFTAPGNNGISPDDKTTVNGRKVGVNLDSVQADFLAEWCGQYGVQPEVVLVSCSEEESLRMLMEGELDAYVTVDSFMDTSVAVPVFKIGSSDYYFAVSKTRPDLVDDLDSAMSKIQDENRFYNLEMYEKYLRRTGANAYLSAAEAEWLLAHGPIRVGYQDNYLAFCARDKETGELTGVLRDYLNTASDCIPNVHITFQSVCFSTAGEAMEALKKGEIDCVFPSNLRGYEAERLNTVMSPSLIDTEMYAVVRSSDPKIFNKQGNVIVAVNKGNTNYDAFLDRYYPSWGRAYFEDSEACLEAVSRGDADCLIISNYRYNSMARLCEKLHLTTFSLGIDLDYCFAVEKGQRELYSILAKVVSTVPDASINAAFSHYITEEARGTFADFLEDNLFVVLTVALVIVVVIFMLLLQNMRAVRKARTLISATETDDLTGLLNRKYFFQYAERMHREHPDVRMDAIVLNIEQFHSINAIHGRSLGNQVLRELGNEIRALQVELNGIAGRFEADRFDIYCHHRDDYQPVFDRIQGRLEALAPNLNIRLRMGVMHWQKGIDVEQMFDHARTACTMARGHYSTRLIVYDATVNARESYEQRLVNDLRHALEHDEFTVFYQPKFDIQCDPPAFVSAEALVRWNHPELGLIPPGDFISLFEKNGQIGLVDKYVWSQAAAQVAQWKKKFGKVIPVSVNLSRIDVFDPSLEETLGGILSSNGLDHHAFRLEVTESAYTENADQVIHVVGSLRHSGFEVEMDDFGTGYSSLNMLSSMPIDVLKMDMQFVRNIDNNEKDRQLVALIIGIANNLKVPVIAEGVERESQLKLLRDLGCAMVQGFYFSRPLPADEFAQRFLN